MKSRYLQIGLGSNMGPPSGVRSNDGGLNAPCDLEKWKTSVLPCSITRLNLVRRDKITL